MNPCRHSTRRYTICECSQCGLNEMTCKVCFEHAHFGHHQNQGVTDDKLSNQQKRNNVTSGAHNKKRKLDKSLQVIDLTADDDCVINIVIEVPQTLEIAHNDGEDQKRSENVKQLHGNMTTKSTTDSNVTKLMKDNPPKSIELTNDEMNSEIQFSSTTSQNHIMRDKTELQKCAGNSVKVMNVTDADKPLQSSASLHVEETPDITTQHERSHYTAKECDESWWRSYDLVIGYHETCGTYNVPLNHISETEGTVIPLGEWLHAQRKLFKKLAEDRREALVELVATSRMWEKMKVVDAAEKKNHVAVKSTQSVQQFYNQKNDCYTDTHSLGNVNNHSMAKKHRSVGTSCDIQSRDTSSECTRSNGNSRNVNVNTYTSSSTMYNQQVSRDNSNSENNDMPTSTPQNRVYNSLSALVNNGREPVPSSNVSVVRNGRFVRVKRSPYTKIHVHKGSVVAYAKLINNTYHMLIGKVTRQLTEGLPTNAQTCWRIQQMTPDTTTTDTTIGYCMSILNSKFHQDVQQHSVQAEHILHSRVELKDGMLIERSKKDLISILDTSPLMLKL